MIFNVCKHYDVVLVGKQGENNAREIRFDFSAWKHDFGAGLVTIVYKRKGDTSPYPVAVTYDGDIAIWKPNVADTDKAGAGFCELVYTVNGVIAKSVTYSTYVAPCVGEQTITPPEPQQSWVDMVIEKAGEAVQAKEDAENARDAAQTAQSNAETAADGAYASYTGAENAKQAILDTSATASVDANVGTPEVVVTKTEVEGHANLGFAFHNIKGEQGETGDSGVYVGETEPTGDENVWIDPNGTPTPAGGVTWIEFTIGAGQTVTASHTPEEVRELIESGETVIAKIIAGDESYQALPGYFLGKTIFSVAMHDDNIVYYINIASNSAHTTWMCVAGENTQSALYRHSYTISAKVATESENDYAWFTFSLIDTSESCPNSAEDIAKYLINKGYKDDDYLTASGSVTDNGVQYPIVGIQGSTWSGSQGISGEGFLYVMSHLGYAVSNPFAILEVTNTNRFYCKTERLM